MIALIGGEIWLSNLGIEPTEENFVEKEELSSSVSSNAYTAVKKEFSSTNTAKRSYRDNFDVAFLIDSRIGNNEQIDEIKKNILKVCEEVFLLSPNARVRFIQLLSVEHSEVGFYQTLTDENNNEISNFYPVF